MRVHAPVYKAQAYIKALTGITVYAPLEDERGRVVFAIAPRHMLQMALSIKEKLSSGEILRSEFERTAHYIADTIILDKYKTIQLKYMYGSTKATISLIDTEDVYDDEDDDDMGYDDSSYDGLGYPV